MLASSHEISNLEDLRNFVTATLCEYEQLEPGAFPMTERILIRGGQPCGIFYCLHGPRSVKITAIWETDRNRIWFYGSTGQRFQKVQLAAVLTPHLLTRPDEVSHSPLPVSLPS